MVSANITTTGSYLRNSLSKFSNTEPVNSGEDFTSVMAKSSKVNSEEKTDSNVYKNTKPAEKETASKNDKEESLVEDKSNEPDKSKLETTLNKLKNNIKKAKEKVIENTDATAQVFIMYTLGNEKSLDENTLKTQIAEKLDIPTKELEEYMTVLNFTVSDLSVLENAMKLAMLSQGIDEASTLLVNSDLADNVSKLAIEISKLMEASENTDDSQLQTDITETLNQQEEYLTATKDGNESTEKEIDATLEKTDEIVEFSGKEISDKLGRMSKDDQNNNLSYEKRDNSQNFEARFNLNSANISEIVDNLTNAITEASEDINEARIVSQIIEQVRVNARPEMTSMEMQLYPEHLGKVTIQVVSNEGTLSAKIVAETESVKNAIEGQLTLLKESLNNQGIKVDSVEVTIASHSFEQNLEDGQQKEENSQHRSHRVRKSLVNEINNDTFLEDITEEEKMETIGNTVSYKA